MELSGQKIREEILDWANEPNEVLFAVIGRSLNDKNPLGFAGGAVASANQASQVASGERWCAEMLDAFCDGYVELKVLKPVELAISLASAIEISFPSMPLGPVALIAARKITARRKHLEGTVEIEGVTKERSDLVSEENKIGEEGRELLSGIFERANEIAAKTLKGRPAAGSEHAARTVVRARIDDEVVAWIKDQNPKVSTQINGILRALMEADQEETEQGPEEPTLK